MSKFNQEKGFTHILAVSVVGLFVFSIITSFIPVKRNYNDGKSNVAGVYLVRGGDDGGGSSGGGESRDSGGSSSNTQSAPEVKTNSPEIKKEESKVETRIETKSNPGEIRTYIRQDDLRMKFETEKGKVKIETKVKEGNKETELENGAEDEALKEMETELEKKDIKISTVAGQVALVNKKVGALSSFPLSVNPTTRELTVTTPAGTKVVTVLPQKALDNMLASHVMDDVISEQSNSSLASVPDLIKLETENGVLGYKIKGTKTHKLFGLISVKTAVDTFVSAENGQVVETNQSLLGRILNRIAP